MRTRTYLILWSALLVGVVLVVVLTGRSSSDPPYDVNPSWSPDGTKIAFDSSRDGNTEIYVMDADGSNQINLTNNSAFDGCFDWSPDGSKIVFTSDRGGNFVSRITSDNITMSEIYVMDANGSNQTRLTSTADDLYRELDW